VRLVIFATLAFAFAAPAFAASYSNDFEGEAVGTLPAGWYEAQWWDSGAGLVHGTVQAAPGGGQALAIVWETDWALGYDNSNGEVGYTLGVGGDSAQLHYEYDMWRYNWAIWVATGDQTWFPPGGLHMNDNPDVGPNHMFVGRDGPEPPDLTDVPEGDWVHVVTDFDAATDQWVTTISYGGGSGGGVFTGMSDVPVVGQWWMGGWAFQSQMDTWINRGFYTSYENVIYIDNFMVSVVPEPATLLGFASVLGLLALRRRK
jgi:hypothetical protein